MDERGDFNRNGGLTLVPMPGFEKQAEAVKTKVEEIGRREGKRRTFVDIVIPEFGERVTHAPYLRLGKDHIGGHDVVVIGGGPGNWTDLGQLNLLLAYIKGRRAVRIATILGCFPLARSDKDIGELEFAMPNYVVGQMLAATGGKLDRIVSTDLHADQIVMSAPMGFITPISLTRRVMAEAADWIAVRYPSSKVVLAFTDAGGIKRAKPSITRVEKDKFNGQSLPIVQGTKTRESSQKSQLDGLTGALSSVENAVVLMVDDEFTTGKTSNDTAEALTKDHGAKAIVVAVTHGPFSGNVVELLLDGGRFIDHIFSTDTIPFYNRPNLEPLFDRNLLTVVPWTDDMGWICFQHHGDESIRIVR